MGKLGLQTQLAQAVEPQVFPHPQEEAFLFLHSLGIGTCGNPELLLTQHMIIGFEKGKPLQALRLEWNTNSPKIILFVREMPWSPMN
jgi:hypothetical protein